MRTLLLRGEDVGDLTYWAWEWSDGSAPGFATVPRTEMSRLLDRLDRALPGMVAEEAEASSSELLDLADAKLLLPELRRRARRARQDAELRSLLMMQRCFTGALASMDDERALSSELAALLLPAALVETLRQRSTRFGAEHVELRVLPAPSCARVPWELLIVDDAGERRVLDLARVVTMAPILGRDGDAAIPHPDWVQRRHLPPLHVIDPRVPGRGGVLTPVQAASWPDRVAAGGSVRGGVDREWLSTRLRGGVSRFYYLGHVEADASTAGKTALVVDDDWRMYGLGRRTDGTGSALRYLTAQDFVAGTVGRDAHVRRLAQAERLPPADMWRREYGDEVGYPSAALDADGVAQDVRGSDIWPMPPRVALIACQSGADFHHAEPFGLVTAFLEAGAELVTATRWVMLTDNAFALVTTGTPFDDLAVAVDGIQQSEDPLAALAVWQRERLAAWRRSGALADSPLTWAAVTNCHAPDRTERAAGGGPGRDGEAPNT